MARWCRGTPALSGLRGSSRNGGMRPIARGARGCGSRSSARAMIRTPADGVGRGFSGIGNADRLKRHESGGRTMAHVADHLSFETLADLERAIADRCRVLDGDQLSLGTNFHWWPKPAWPKPAKPA